MATYIHLLTLAQDRLFFALDYPFLTWEERDETWHLIDEIEMKKHFVLSQALRAGALNI